MAAFGQKNRPTSLWQRRSAAGVSRLRHR